MTYEYNVYTEYSREEFKKVVELIKNNTKNIKETEYVEDPLDGDQIQIIITDNGKIVIKNDFMVGAVWVESDFELEIL